MNTQVHVNRYTHVSGTLNHNDKMLRTQVMHLYRYLISLLNLYMHTHIPESFIHTSKNQGYCRSHKCHDKNKRKNI